MYIQKTIENEIKCQSVGLHSGRKIDMTIKPAGVDEGIVFYRNDLPGSDVIRAEPTNVSDTTLATTLGMNGTRISTVEHLLSAFFGMGVDNVIVETPITGVEPEKLDISVENDVLTITGESEHKSHPDG